MKEFKDATNNDENKTVPKANGATAGAPPSMCIRCVGGLQLGPSSDG